MNPFVEQNLRPAIYDMLYSLGISANYAGFFFTSDAVYLTLQQPDRLLLITKWLYPDIAKRYNTSWHNVERCIRKTVEVAWKLRTEKLCSIAKRDLERRPTNSQFISMLASYLRFQTVSENRILHSEI